MLLTDTTQLTKTFSCTRLEVQALPVIPDGKVLCMTVNGILQDVKPGIYTGKVTVYLLDAMTEDIAAEIRPEGGPGAPGAPDGLKMMGPPDGMAPPPDQHIYVNYISALTIDETGPIPEQSAEIGRAHV